MNAIATTPMVIVIRWISISFRIYRVIDNPGLYALSNSRRYVPRRIFRKTSLPQQRIRNGRFKFESIIRFILGHIQIISDVQIIPISNTIDRITHPTRILG